MKKIALFVFIILSTSAIAKDFIVGLGKKCNLSMETIICKTGLTCIPDSYPNCLNQADPKIGTCVKLIKNVNDSCCSHHVNTTTLCTDVCDDSLDLFCRVNITIPGHQQPNPPYYCQKKSEWGDPCTFKVCETSTNYLGEFSDATVDGRPCATGLKCISSPYPNPVYNVDDVELVDINYGGICAKVSKYVGPCCDMTHSGQPCNYICDKGLYCNMEDSMWRCTTSKPANADDGTIYPNPFTDRTTVLCLKDKNVVGKDSATLTIYNLNGKIVQPSIKLSSSFNVPECIGGFALNVDTSMSTGMYFFTVTSGSGKGAYMKTYKVLKNSQ